MVQNAQLDAPFTSDVAIPEGYHFPMDGNTPVSAPPGPPPPWPQYYPPAKPARRWLPVAIIVAAIIIATAVISAVLLSRDNTAPAAGPAPTAVGSAPAQGGTTEASSTCNAWETTRATLDVGPGLPAGWDWNTPNIGTYISNRNAATTKVIDLFEPKIAETPADVAAAAREYVVAKRNEMRMLTDKSFTSADAASVNVARAQLDQLCNVN